MRENFRPTSPAKPPTVWVGTPVAPAGQPARFTTYPSPNPPQIKSAGVGNAASKIGVVTARGVKPHANSK